MQDHDDFRERERRRVARCMQERAENAGELADALYVWNAQMLSNDQCLVLPGDYMAVGSCCMCSSRGAMVDMDADDIHALIMSGALSQVFDLDDLNAPDFDDLLDHAMDRIRAQREFRDATCYYCTHGLEQAVAVWDVPPDPEHGNPGCTAAVGRAGDRFEFGTVSVTGSSPLRQCTYEEFNPGGREITAMAREESKPEQGASRGKLFQEMQEKYLSDGENDVVKPDEAARRIPGYGSMSPREQLAARVQAADEYHKSVARTSAQERRPDAGDQWGPKLPGGRLANMD